MGICHTQGASIEGNGEFVFRCSFGKEAIGAVCFADACWFTGFETVARQAALEEMYIKFFFPSRDDLGTPSSVPVIDDAEVFALELIQIASSGDVGECITG